MRYAIKLGGALASLMVVASCGSGHVPTTASTTPAASPENGISDLPVKIGAPFIVGGTTYIPVDIANYDEVGYASFYGVELSSKPTANGEVFLPAGITAAHKTLPLPSYVEVTALDTGRTILVRINDRGPFANERLLDLSEGAAQQLGITAKGVSGVRVRRVNPPEQERAVLRAGLRAAERIETPESLLRILRDKIGKQAKPPTIASNTPSTMQSPQSVEAALQATNDRFIREGGGKPARAVVITREATPATPTDADSYMVQVAAFSSRSRADHLARKLGANVTASADSKLFRVHYGPYASETKAKLKQADAKKHGHPQARIYRD